MTTTNRHQQIEQALTDLHHAGVRVSIAAIATHTGIARATLYRHPELIALINEHRAHIGTDLTLTGLHTDIVHLRIGIDALAERVRHHEERLRHLERGRATGSKT
ncbi:hypothetical protein [Rhodoglobus aureus]|uniref:Uncharacterized protein n=1 Tax=Rhodoglobus aureus TaxID=191497 RepID=A0ABN1W2J0_9MICO